MPESNRVGREHTTAAEHLPARRAVGIVSTSPTGLKEVTCLLAREGVGISQAIQVDSRDLETETGGERMRSGLHTLQADPATEVIVLLGGWSATGPIHRVLAGVRESEKPTVICFLGVDRNLAWRVGAIPASRLDEASMRAAAWVRGWDQALVSSRLADQDEQLADQARALQARVGPGRNQIVGLLSGGLFCHEAQVMVADVAGNTVEASFRDVGTEEDLEDVVQLLEQALDNPKAGVALLDVVLDGDDGPWQDSLLAGMGQKRRQGALVITHICGLMDIERLEEVKAILEDAGFVVAESNAAAARLAGMVVGGTSGSRKFAGYQTTGGTLR